jgi:hypothetical protein
MKQSCGRHIPHSPYTMEAFDHPLTRAPMFSRRRINESMQPRKRKRQKLSRRKRKTPKGSTERLRESSKRKRKGS